MNLIFFLLPLIFLVIPNSLKSIHYIELVPLLFLYFDITSSFMEGSAIYLYYEYLFIFLLLIDATYKNGWKLINGFNVFTYLILTNIIFQVFLNTSLSQVFKGFLMNQASLVLLPISFYYYSKGKSLKKLFYVSFIFITIYILFVLIATPLKLGGEKSELVAGTTFYYGNIATRGGLTYISFLILLIPLIIQVLKYWQKIILIISALMIMIFFLSALKRFVFLVLALGILNFIFRPTMKMKSRIQISTVIVFIGIFIITNDFVINATETRYLERGGENKFSTESVETDLRIYEPLYVLQNVLEKPWYNFFIGDNVKAEYELEHLNITQSRKIHNTYASLLSEVGIVGLLIYLSIYFKIYRRVSPYYNYLKKTSKKYLFYWISFQNLLLLFLLQGMVGGHVHVSLRGLVFLYMGAIGGYFYSEYQKHIMSIPENQVKSFQTFH